ncbi:MAG: acetyl-CoA carboxylase carboxyltransferase subunit alpha [Alphaproteobacteria bacterium]|nr:acetyl-CoA carboxylase carboxyltransferase subunit alpha [Alphaproteobacteria bacterium]
MQGLDFEKTIQEVEAKLAALENAEKNKHNTAEIKRLSEKLFKEQQQTYAHLTPWQKTQVARHLARPQTSDYIQALIQDFSPLRGDRCFGEDASILGGIGRFNGKPVMVIGNEKGHDTPSRVKHNFGMAQPEGYRKAIRLMKLAEQFHMPILTFVDTPGAFPGVEGEERGQAQAIAQAMQTALSLTVPNISVVTGEGGSGGAIAIAASNMVFMLEHSIYSVISPEGCASILYKDAGKADKAASSLALTAQDLLRLKVIDAIIPEPAGGAHRYPNETFANVKQALTQALKQLSTLSGDQIRRHRHQKFETMTRLG